MAEEKMMRLSQVARILNVGTSTIVDYLSTKGFKVDSSPNTKLNAAQIDSLAKEYDSDKLRDSGGRQKPAAEPEPEKKEAKQESGVDEVLYFRTPPSSPVEAEKKEEKPAEKPIEEEKNLPIEAKLPGIKVVGKIDLNARKPIAAPKPEPKPAPVAKEEPVAPQPEAPKPEPEVEAPEVKAPEIEEKKAAPPVEEPAPKPEPVEATKPVEPAEAPVAETPPVEKAPEIAAKVPEEVKPAPAPKPVEAIAPKAETPPPAVEPDATEADDVIEAKGKQLRGLKVVGKIELPSERTKKKDAATGEASDKKRRRKRKRIRDNRGEATPAPGAATGTPVPRTTTTAKGTTAGSSTPRGKASSRRGGRREEVSDKEVADNIKATMARMGSGTVTQQRGRAASKRRRDRADQDDSGFDQNETKILRVTEYISANELASLMDVSVQEVISVCLSMGMFVSINQRIDAEAITFIADEFGYEVEFISAEEEIQNEVVDVVDDPEDLEERAPIVTIMGHVDHGKTSLLDYIRSENVASGEAGGITQHIGAYSVKTKSGKQVTFLDTPGHEAFTAMRARGAKVTDVVIVVIAADDSVMPQTREAINHAQVAGVPIVFAFSKVDKPGANTEKIREELSQMNYLVEDWGGKYQSQEISSKSGMGVDDLLEKVLLEAELLELKANPDRRAVGTVVEASLDKGRGYVTTILVQAGTLKVGDIILAGAHHGRVKAMTDYLGKKLKKAGPSDPVQVLGLNGAPQAGDKFNVMDQERDARELANKREQILREQTIRSRKHITLEEIGRRKAIGSFKELNLIVKGDVDGSVEALSDSLLQLSTSEIQVNTIHKAVGQISESDVNLAIASDAIIVGFQVRPSPSAKRMAEQEQIEIRHYSVIYQAIDEIKDAMTGMLAPTVEETVTGNIEIREVFKISRIGTIAGCYVTDGFVKRNNKIRIIRDGIVIHTGEIDSLKRFKEDVSEVRSGYECGLNIKNFNDIEEGDIIESFELKEVKRTL
ncbi:translation initiation factor IF-2 [Persicitalea jodogahamensis]|nr:translation initiation factor IF-2 [Persicitalea jodogahamensis]